MENVKSLLNDIKENISLAEHTTFRIGGPAKYFFVAKTSDDIKKAIEAAKKLKIPYYVIGNGSNILVSDSGFDGIVIKAENRNLEVNGERIIVASGVILGKMVSEAMKSGLTGLEWMAGIPGTIGGALYGNAGAFGHSISESVEGIEVFDAEDLSVKSLNKTECGFGYRTSIFKEKKYVILSATIKLEKGDKDKSDKITRDYLGKRKGKHPIGPSAGSVFKNPSLSDNEKAFKKILEKFPEAEKFKATGKIPAGWLIEEYGLLGKKIGGAVIAKEHGNFIINIGGAKATDVVMLISMIKQKIRVNFGIQLEEEIQYVGF